MIVFPAIDMIGGSCVRLVKGDYSTAARMAPDIARAALGFEQAGARWLHMVDLDGAKAKKRVNHEKVLEVLDKTGLKVQLGGGIRTLEDMEYYLNAGVSRIILGSIALQDFELTKRAVARFGEQIAIGIDADGDRVKTEGWTEQSDTDYLELARRMEDIGVKTIIYTDISRDGTLEGLNLQNLERLARTVGCDIIASGGVRDLEDFSARGRLGL